MKQTGQYKAIQNGAVIDFKYAVTFILKKTDKTEIRRNTNKTGAWDFDVPIGDYFVSAFLTDSEHKTTLDFQSGLLLSITNQSKVTALFDWCFGVTAGGKDPMKDWWDNLLKDTQKASNEAKQARDEIKNNSIGDTNGKWLKEGASKSDSLKTFGQYYSVDNVPKLEEGDTGLSYARHFKANNIGLDFANTGIGENEFLYYEVQKNYSQNNAKIIEFKGYRSRAIYAQSCYKADGTWTKPVVFYNQGDTTVDSNGFIKSASPIIKLFNDHIEHNNMFKEEPIFERLGVGTYKISNTHGLAKEGWTYEKPRGSDGNPYFRIVVEKLEDGCIVSVHDEYESFEKAEIIDADGNKRLINKVVKILGQKRDIKPHERWIDLRFHEEIEEQEIIE